MIMGDREKYETSRRAVLRGSALGAGALFGAAGLSATARAATGTSAPVGEPVGDQYFLKIEGITGDVTTKGLEGFIGLDDFSVGASHTASNGAASGKAKEVQVHFDAPSSIASPLLMLNVVNGKPIKTGAVYVTDANNNIFIKMDLVDVLVSSYEIIAVDQARPEDKGTLSFGAIKFAFYHQNADGLPSSPVKMAWDFRSNKA
jgi:type VI protein secretion system component Hcp